MKFVDWLTRGEEREKETEFLPAILEVTESPPSPTGRLVLWTVMALIVITVVWAFVGHINEVAVAEGTVVPSGQAKTVQVKDKGIVQEILVKENSPLIKSVIRWFRDKGVEYDDLYQLGCMGFLKAINNFDVSFNVKFSTYVVPMVVGEIKRFMRDDGAIKVSRAIKGLNVKINKFSDKFLMENGRQPSISEISKHFKIEENEVVMIMDSAKMPMSLYTPLDDGEEDGLTIIDRFDGQNNEDFVENFALKDMIDKLEERDKKIILLRYFYDKTQSEIAERLGVSQVQVSRLENKILENLKKKLKE